MKRGKAAIFLTLLITRCNYPICPKCLGLFEWFEICPLKVKCAWIMYYASGLIKIKRLFFL